MCINLGCPPPLCFVPVPVLVPIVSKPILIGLKNSDVGLQFLVRCNADPWIRINLHADPAVDPDTVRKNHPERKESYNYIFLYLVVGTTYLI